MDTDHGDRSAELTAELNLLRSKTNRLSGLLAEAKEQIVSLREEADRLASPPAGYGVLLGLAPVQDEDGRSSDVVVADVFTGGRKVRCAVSTQLEIDDLQPGRQVLVNETLNVIKVLEVEQVGEVCHLKDVLPDRRRAVVNTQSDSDTVVLLAEHLQADRLRPGDALLVDRRTQFVYEVLPKLDVEELVLEEVPDIEYDQIGGLGAQLEAIQDAVELPFLHPDVYADHRLRPPKGILLYGPPGCGKTMIAKAVAHSLAQKAAAKTGTEGRGFFINIKGPELLNKYVGETERQIRQVFAKARDKAVEGVPVVVFFDEMDSLFRTRGSGVSSDVENTIVPQLLSEIDGVEGLHNVIVIGASNREDMIDPAILRPGRLDVKIKIERPDAQAAREIFSKYLTDELPLHDDDLAQFDGDRERCVDGMIDATVERMYSTGEENRFLEVTYAGGDKEILYFKDFNSGAMIGNIVDRAKKMAIKDWLTSQQRGIRVDHLLQACVDEFTENEDLPNTTNPDDWAKISGKKGERIVFIRTLVSTKSPGAASRSIETVSNTGQYL
ncbi:MAG TPA: proteasome ATPase [Candidatus Avipropionibacterium avicola]|uniref:AAA ATPase forming ring-shaped complexes n=1 Tax=Candidatus Avipropionibacterium avicola TaxID=2840701 RepID=A0A9D1GY72_9ACTN|nr:proteasome ATPase [Candidatus Avipropionibacterium avicola]